MGRRWIDWVAGMEGEGEGADVHIHRYIRGRLCRSLRTHKNPRVQRYYLRSREISSCMHVSPAFWKRSKYAHDALLSFSLSFLFLYLCTTYLPTLYPSPPLFVRSAVLRGTYVTPSVRPAKVFPHVHWVSAQPRRTRVGPCGSRWKYDAAAYESYSRLWEWRKREVPVLEWVRGQVGRSERL